MLSHVPERSKPGHTRLVTPPACEPVTAAELAAHSALAAIDPETEDAAALAELALRERAIAAARRLAEGFTGRAFIEQTWELAFDGGLSALDLGLSRLSTGLPREFSIPKPPLLAVSQIEYYTEDSDDPVEYALSNVQVSTRREPAILTLKRNSLWPVVRPVEGLVITYRAGYYAIDPEPEGEDGEAAELAAARAAVPADIKQAILQWAAYLYEQREGQPSDNAGGAIVLDHGPYIPAGVRALLADYRIRNI